MDRRSSGVLACEVHGLGILACPARKAPSCLAPSLPAIRSCRALRLRSGQAARSEVEAHIPFPFRGRVRVGVRLPILQAGSRCQPSAGRPAGDEAAGLPCAAHVGGRASQTRFAQTAKPGCHRRRRAARRHFRDCGSIGSSVCGPSIGRLSRQTADSRRHRFWGTCGSLSCSQLMSASEIACLGSGKGMSVVPPVLN